MKIVRNKAFTQWFALMTLFLPQLVYCEPADDRSLSPYFQVISENIGEVEALPLEATSVQAGIAGVIADVRVTQTYRNRGRSPIDAIYVFPASTRAAVYAMRMQIGERVIQAKIKERAAARTEFNRAKSQGKRVSLLEQQRPNVFQMNVANILPGDAVTVELRYTEILIPDQGIYEFVYPAVVGPRYSNTPEANAPESEAWIANPFLPKGQRPAHRFDIQVTLSTGIPIQGLISPSHDIAVDFEGQGRARIALKDGADSGADRDYILQYRLKGAQIESGLLLHEGEKENYFLLMTQPPKRIKAEQIPPREYIFVMDVSGSMHGFPLDTAKGLMKELLVDLKPADRFNIVYFSGGSAALAQSSIPASAENIQAAVAMLENIQGSGGTELLPALKHAMSFEKPRGVARSFVIVSDGYVSVEAEAFDFVREHLNQANFFAFGIGSSVNRYLIEGLVRAGRGEPFIMTKPDQARRLAARFKEYIEAPLLTGIEVDFGGFDAYDVEPQVAPDLFAERPLILFGKWRGDAKGEIRIRGHQGESRVSQSLSVEKDALRRDNSALRYLWARERIAELGDYQKLSPDSEYRDEIKRLGLEYNLLTAYTSFIAVDDMIANPEGQSRTVKQPLPLPAGVSEMAVRGIVPTTPEPEMAFLLFTAGILGLSGLYRRRCRSLVANLF